MRILTSPPPSLEKISAGEEHISTGSEFIETEISKNS